MELSCPRPTDAPEVLTKDTFPAQEGYRIFTGIGPDLMEAAKAATRRCLGPLLVPKESQSWRPTRYWEWLASCGSTKSSTSRTGSSVACFRGDSSRSARPVIASSPEFGHRYRRYSSTGRDDSSFNSPGICLPLTPEYSAGAIKVA